jgi:hypothetical protein
MSDVSLRRRVRARRALAFSGLASLATGLLLLPAASPSSAQITGGSVRQVSEPVRHAGSGSGVTVTGKNLWDTAAGKPFAKPSTVTVSQTAGLTDQLVHVSWTNFTPSQSSGQLGPWYTPTTYYAVMAVECRGTNPTAWSDCYEADLKGSSPPSGPSGPPNEQYAITNGQGTGQLNLLVETSLTNSVLGCDQNHPCSLVVVPGQGGSPTNCQDHTGDIGFANSGTALAGQTFFDATGGCSWNDRIIVPLHFAPTPSSCPQRNAAFSAAGSPMLAVAMSQWLAGLCAGRQGITVAYSSALTEPAAVSSAVVGGTDVALTTQPASADGIATGNKPFVYAPIAVSAASIDYWIDDNNFGQPLSGQPLSGLRLNQRLLAKLVTTSYNPAIACQKGQPPGCDTGVYHNPWNIFKDPEFKQLNAGLVSNVAPLSFPPDMTPTVQLGQIDLAWTATRWIGASADASSFLKGTFDPWGMHVNSYYLGLTYPASQFVTQDPSLVWSQEYSPTSTLAQAVTYQALSQDAGSFQPVQAPGTGYSKDPPEPVGDRALIAVLDQGDAALNHFPTAAIPNAAGKYVQPSNTAMAAAVSHMVSNGSGTVQVDLSRKDPNAYPLTMVIYAMVPTSGLPHAKAAAIARFLDFAAGAGQTPGIQPGQLPAGYLPLPASMRAQTRKLAVEVAKQTGNTTGGGSPGGRGHGGGNPSGTGSGNPGGSTPAGGSAPGSQPSGTSSTPAGKGTSGGTHPSTTAHSPISLVSSHAGPASITRFALPALLILGAIAALGGSFALAGSAEGGALARLRRLSRATAAWSRQAAKSRPGPRHLTRRRKP